MQTIFLSFSSLTCIFVRESIFFPIALKASFTFCRCLHWKWNDDERMARTPWNGDDSKVRHRLRRRRKMFYQKSEQKQKNSSQRWWKYQLLGLKCRALSKHIWELITSRSKSCSKRRHHHHHQLKQLSLSSIWKNFVFHLLNCFATGINRRNYSRIKFYFFFFFLLWVRCDGETYLTNIYSCHRVQKNLWHDGRKSCSSSEGQWCAQNEKHRWNFSSLALIFWDLQLLQQRADKIWPWSHYTSYHHMINRFKM